MRMKPVDEPLGQGSPRGDAIIDFWQLLKQRELRTTDLETAVTIDSAGTTTAIAKVTIQTPLQALGNGQQYTVLQPSGSFWLRHRRSLTDTVITRQTPSKSCQLYRDSFGHHPPSKKRPRFSTIIAALKSTLSKVKKVDKEGEEGRAAAREDRRHHGRDIGWMGKASLRVVGLWCPHCFWVHL
ncbi:hypothetical protein AC578_9672 [Pseudocercospora eumusae]|uniref:Uncharacterized protein n=1 Tax=Pseudocercospora eumusae TaxID=321146 RepID=A0A139HQR9_9PEZI|nr:hypothetical protein AC578_9672 [Pseudocercospora eumusae]